MWSRSRIIEHCLSTQLSFSLCSSKPLCSASLKVCLHCFGSQEGSYEVPVRHSARRLPKGSFMSLRASCGGCPELVRGKRGGREGAGTLAPGLNGSFHSIQEAHSINTPRGSELISTGPPGSSLLALQERGSSVRPH